MKDFFCMDVVAMLSWWGIYSLWELKTCTWKSVVKLLSSRGIMIVFSCDIMFVFWLYSPYYQLTFVFIAFLINSNFFFDGINKHSKYPNLKLFHRFMASGAIKFSQFSMLASNCLISIIETFCMEKIFLLDKYATIWISRMLFMSIFCMTLEFTQYGLLTCI
jgi:hypothetical protein